MREYPRKTPKGGWNRWAAPAPGANPVTRGLYSLTFLLPAILALLAPVGRHCPCLMGCLVTVGRNGFVVVDGTSREGVFEQTGRFLRQLLKVLRDAGNVPPATSIAGRLRGPTGEDSWQIVIGAEVAFAPGGIEAQFPAGEAAE
jgi:hypothetical protein